MTRTELFRPCALRLSLLIPLLLLALLPAAALRAQQGPAWVQIEAQPTLPQAEDRARAYAAMFPDVVGHRMVSGWYAIALGPYSPDIAQVRLADLLREGLVPVDSFLSDGRNYRARYWPGDESGSALPPDVHVETLGDPLAPLAEGLPEATEPDALAALPQTLAPPPPADESPAEARRSEALLTGLERQDLQTALQWYGFYTSAIDGAFGPGTRNSMAAWQAANGMEPTGILTSSQRQVLLSSYATAQAELDLQTVTEEEAGIEITLPLALVQFDRYEPPFVHFDERDGSGMRVILISQPGDQASLTGLYDVLQTLEVVPLEGARERRSDGFTIEGRNAATASYSRAELSQGLIKGYMLVWNPADDERAARVLGAMQASFRPVSGRALDPGLVVMPEETRLALLSGLEVRRPRLSRSGFYVDGSGAVLTTVEAVESCGRITIDRTTEADLAFADPALGIALLRPRSALSPVAVAEFQGAAHRPGADVAVAGYSYEDRLPAPSLTFGALAEATGLEGEASLRRLSLEALPGDAGGPVLDGGGAVLGMLLPRESGTARELPPEVSFALAAGAISGRLGSDGVTPRESGGLAAMMPEDLTRLARNMTVLVSCWN